MRFPNTLFARAFLLIAVLILLSLSSALVIFRHVQEEPHAQQMSQMVVAVVNLTRAAMLSAAPEWHSALWAELADAEGLRVSIAEPGEILVPIPSNQTELILMVKKARARLGDDTRFALRRNDIPGLWVSFYIGDEAFWVAVPLERIENTYSKLLPIWGSVVLLLALLGGYFIARQVSRPLKKMADAAQQLGRGATPANLPEYGPQEIVAVSQAFNQMSTDLAAYERERALVLAGISHDLRTPLTRVRLAAEMSDDEMLRTGLSADVEQMDEVIQQFLDYARPDQHEVLEPTDVGQLINEMLQRYPDTVFIMQTPNPLLWPIKPLMFKRAISNLLENAFKYGAGRVEVGLEICGNSLILSVSDNGKGIPDEHRDHVKRAFVRLEGARSDAGGAGLGLAIVERAARMHGGELRLGQSTLGGLRAELVLPKKIASR